MNAPTEQTEAQDDKEVTPLYSAIITDMCDEIESLRAQLEAARGESKRTTDACAKYEVQLEQKMQEHQDELSEMRGRMEGAEPVLQAVAACNLCKICSARARAALSPPSAEAV